MDKELKQLRGVFVRRMFTSLLLAIKRTDNLQENERLLASIKEKTKRILDPDLIVWVSTLEEQVKLEKNLRKLVQDIIDLDWEKEETELQYLSMLNCFEAMRVQNEKIGEFAATLREGLE